MADSAFTPPPVKDNRTAPPGVLPKNIQNWLLAGIALVMILVIALSGGKTPAKKESLPMQAAVVPSAERILEYQKRIEEETRKLQLQQAELARTQQELSPASGASANANSWQGSYGTVPTAYSERNAQKESIRLDREKREYESLFASNIALS